MTRRANDAYYTPDALAERLVSILPLRANHTVCEPHAGGGAFLRAIEKRTPHTVAMDIDPECPVLRTVTHAIQQDFLMEDLRAGHGWPERPFNWVIGNPPFEDAEKHVRHALSLASDGVAFLLRLAFLESVKREAFWEQHPCSDIVVLNKRPCFTGNGKTDSCAYGFFIWNTKYPTQPGRTCLHVLSSVQRLLPDGE